MSRTLPPTSVHTPNYTHSLTPNHYSSMNAILSYFCSEVPPLIDENAFETTQRTVNFVLEIDPSNTGPIASKSLYQQLKNRLQKWQQLQPYLHANLLHVRGYKPVLNDSEELESVDVITDEWPTVLEYITRNKPDDTQKLKFCVDLANAVLDLHNNDFAHGAIRGDNVYVRSDGVCLLGQPAPFDRPSVADLKDHARWFSPEIREPAKFRCMRADHYVDYRGDFLLPNDIYMLATTFAEIYTGTTPITMPTPKNTVELARKQRIVFVEDCENKWGTIPPPLVPLLESMRCLAPVHRHNADKTVDGILCPSLSTLSPSNYCNSKSVARGVLIRTSSMKKAT